jgi:FixJ family two-component response regulator
LSKQYLIALIDDDGSFRTALYESLLSLGYSVNAFASADEFAASSDESSYDCIITDIHMPGMSGIELMKTLAARGSRVPVIMVTARAEPGLEARIEASGAICLLKKPFETKALIGCLQRAMTD